MDNDKKNFDPDVDLDDLLSYYNQDSKKPKSETPLRVDKDTIKANSTSKNTQSGKKKFVVHIDESELDYTGEKSKPADNSSVYFSNYPKRKTNDTSKTSNTANSTISNVKKKVKTVGGNFAVILFVCIILFTTLASYVSISGINDILAVNTSDVVVKVEIPEEATYKDVIDILHENNLIKQKTLCNAFAKFRHYDNEKKYKYLSGVYHLDRTMGVEGMLRKCMAAPESAQTVKLGFPEGWTITQIFEKLEKYDVCRSDRLYAALNDVNYEFDFVRSLPRSEERYQLLEGYIFPDTYDFYIDADANYVIRKFLSNFNDRWTDDYQKRADKLGYSMDEIIIIASIIQKEAADASQMKAVSSVIHNRLKNSVNFPTLGCDSTAIYISNYVTKIVGGSKGNYYLNKYDTAANRGLPPGPICNPGIDAIEAALYPSDTNYYYFLHDDNGKIYMAKTQKEHESNYVLAIKANNSN